MGIFTRLLFAFLMLGFQLRADAQLDVVPEFNAEALAKKLVGGGVIISNITLNGSSLSTGFFHNRSGTRLGLDSGIVLSTGRVLTVGNSYGLNGVQTNQATYSTNAAGDPDLDNLVNPRPTRDAVILEFDFIPIGDSVKFRYVFSSEEYPTFICTNFNDVFAFFISGPGISGLQNIALVPGTNIPVAINSINSGRPVSTANIATCNSMGPGSPFSEYYVDNTGNEFFTHNGHTKILTAAAAVQPCQTYHLKIAIADVNDRSYDSGVFIEAESLRSDPIKIISNNPIAGGSPYLAEGCHSGGIRIERPKQLAVPQVVNILVGGTATNGVDYQPIPSSVTIPANALDVFLPIQPIVDNLAEGVETIKLYISNGCIAANFFADSIVLQIRDYDTLAITPPGRTAICGNNTQQLSATRGYSSYQWSPVLGLNNPQIADPVASPSSLTVYTCTADLGSCHAKDSVTIVKKTLRLLSKADINCAGAGSGEIRVSGGAAWARPATYSINGGSYGTDSVFSQLPVGDYVIRIRDGTGCIDSMKISLVQAYPDLTLSATAVSASCLGTNGKINLTATGGKLPYAYAMDGAIGTSSPGFTVNEGNHTMQLKDANGCLANAGITVDKDAPIRFTALPGSNSCQGGSEGVVYLNAQGGGSQYLYSIDGANFQTVDSFTVSIENFIATVKDEKGCTASQPVFLPLYQPVFVNAGKDTTICEGSSVHFNTAANAVSFLWAPAPGLNVMNIADPVASPVVGTSYSVTATKGICLAYDTITLSVLPAPLAHAGPDSLICIGRSIRLTGSGGASFSWLPASGLNDPLVANPLVKPAQTTDFYLRVFSADGCPSIKYDTVRISLVPALQVFAGRDTVAAIGQPIQLKGVDLSNSGATIFEWTPAFGLNNPSIANPVALPDRDITYQLTMTTPAGCEGSDLISIRVFKAAEIYVPTGFTPNGDGKNDRLRPIAVGIKEFRYFRVFNRWGALVFSSLNDMKEWDGSINGRRQEVGTYVWQAEGVDFHGNLVQRKGVVTLVR